VAGEARGGSRYFDKVSRDGGCVRRLYLGNGPVAELAARDAELRRAELKAELLSGPAASPLEELLVERVGAGWLQTAYADAAAAQARVKPLDLAQLEQQQRRQERAQKGYLAAIRTPATVRKLLATADVRTADLRESSGPSGSAEASSRSAGKAAGSNP
jgi:hypothetical protein